MGSYASGIISMVQSGISWGSMGAQMYSEQEQGNFAKAQADRNAGIAEMAAQDALQRGDEAALVSKMKYGQIEGQQQAAYGASGVDAQTGTPLEVLGDTAALSSLDAQTIQNNAAREAWGYRNKAAEFRIQGAIDKKKADYAEGSTLLTEFGKQGDYGKSMAGSFGGGGG